MPRNQRTEQRYSRNNHALVTRDAQLVRKITRDSIGLFISSILAIFMPWQVLSAGLNAALLWRHVNQFVHLQSELRSRGIRVGKRVIIKAITQGAAVKLAATTLLFGHDDLVGVAGVTDRWLDDAGYFIADHPDTRIHGHTLQEVVNLDADHRDNHHLVHLASSAASAPTEWVQETLQLQTAEDIGQTQMSGWHTSASELAEQVFVVGGVQAATEKATDFVKERPIDRMMDGKEKRIGSLHEKKPSPPHTVFPMYHRSPEEPVRSSWNGYAYPSTTTSPTNFHNVHGGYAPTGQTSRQWHGSAAAHYSGGRHAYSPDRHGGGRR